MNLTVRVTTTPTQKTNKKISLFGFKVYDWITFACF